MFRTCSVTLPITIFSSHFWLCEPITIISACTSVAVFNIVSANSPSENTLVMRNRLGLL